jgi:hypothetical protein
MNTPRTAQSPATANTLLWHCKCHRDWSDTWLSQLIVELFAKQKM